MNSLVLHGVTYGLQLNMVPAAGVEPNC